MAQDEPLIEEELDEALDDLSPIINWADGAVLWSTDWTAETIISQLEKQNIDLDPAFQRRSAWSDKKQSLFIESLILGLPIPQLILAEIKGKKGSYLVIDGKQRLLAIRRFGTIAAGGDFEPLILKGLERTNLNGKKYSDLIQDPILSEDRAAFENASIRTIVIRNWTNEAYLYEVFLRINTGSVQLSPQELRQALHPGPFSQFINTASEESPQLRAALNLTQPDFRMRDAEILLRYLAYRNFIGDYNGNLKVFLDEATRVLNSEWPERQAKLKAQVDEMNLAFEFTMNVFGKKNYLRKWNGHVFEGRKNRAVFDIMLHYFSHAQVRNALAGREAEIVASYKDLCDQNEEFRQSIETTTKSIPANRSRFNIWGDILARLSGLDLSAYKFPV
ncbi:DUF262 domain-containing protein [Agrobacterium cavarae]|uniref:DUF262 domain-containing protein n=1 Tax=Agrobacterium cavarae TaxID=2528239 RepID=UPI003FCF1B09